MKHSLLALCMVIAGLVAVSCGPSAPPPTPETFLTLADVSGRPTFQETSPDVRVIAVKAKAFIKLNDIRAAKERAKELASIQAVDSMVRELLDADTYNKNYEEIDRYMSQNVNNYIDDVEVVGEKKIFNDKYYGIAAAFKVNRQKVLVALQKELKLINTSANSLITVITSKKGIDLSAAGFRFEDMESALMNQIQTDLNQRGLRAMDFRNAITSMQTDETKKAAFSKISKDQFMATIAGSSAGNASLDQQVKGAEEFYSTGLSLIKQLAKVVIEVNIFAVNGNIQGDIALSMNVTAKNIATGTGGAFANTVVNVARRGGPNVIASAMITGLVKDSYEEMTKEFIPQVVKEMSTVSVGGDKLIAYDIVLKGFDEEGSKLRRRISGMENETFRFITLDNTVPTILTLKVRYSGKALKLSDMILGAIEEANVPVKEPIFAPELTDIVFVRDTSKK
ncbi:MAG: hypothetical protein HQM11_00060 [SAR324 cluster bacterium]|nr:hypothetical protein [SAR324 cluster bacterium]